MTVGRLRREITPAEIVDWMAYRRIAPFRNEREFRKDARAALGPMVLANVNRGRSQPAQKLDAFILEWKPRKKKAKSGAELKASFQAAMAGRRRKKKAKRKRKKKRG